MTLALLCSGQARQDRGMFALFGDGPQAAPILSAVDALLGQDHRAFLAGASEAALHANRASQILCVARALLAAASLDLPSPLLIAGYSVGEMAAWGVAGFWSTEQTLHLTAKRAELMDAAGGEDDALGYIRGLCRERVGALVEQFACAIAIVNPGALVIIGGDRQQVERCCAAALAQGAATAGSLPVHVASHTPRLAGAVAPFLSALRAPSLSRPLPGRSLIGATRAEAVQGLVDLPGLAAQLGATIDWAATLEALVERGADRVLELGPGTALADMTRAAYPALNARALDEFRSIAGVSAWIAGTRR